MDYFSHHKGDMFQSEKGVYAHGVNTVGVMGAGIARQFKANYPAMYTSYKYACDTGALTPGNVLYVTISDTHHIANIASQRVPGADARLSWLSLGLNDTYQEMNFRGHNDLGLALPQIGCGIGGLDWETVRPLIEDYANYYEIETEIWSL